MSKSQGVQDQFGQTVMSSWDRMIKTSTEVPVVEHGELTAQGKATLERLRTEHESGQSLVVRIDNYIRRGFTEPKDPQTGISNDLQTDISTLAGIAVAKSSPTTGLQRSYEGLLAQFEGLTFPQVCRQESLPDQKREHDIYDAICLLAVEMRMIVDLEPTSLGQPDLDPGTSKGKSRAPPCGVDDSCQSGEASSAAPPSDDPQPYVDQASRVIADPVEAYYAELDKKRDRFLGPIGLSTETGRTSQVDPVEKRSKEYHDFIGRRH